MLTKVFQAAMSGVQRQPISMLPKLAMHWKQDVLLQRNLALTLLMAASTQQSHKQPVCFIASQDHQSPASHCRTLATSPDHGMQTPHAQCQECVGVAALAQSWSPAIPHRTESQRAEQSGTSSTPTLDKCHLIDLMQRRNPRAYPLQRRIAQEEHPLFSRLAPDF